MTNRGMLQRFVRPGLIVALALSSVSILGAADWPQWRGPQRTATSAETGLLKEWPAAGPRLVWQVKDAGQGFSTPSVVGDRLYLLSNEGLQNEFVRSLNVADGKQVWSTRIGKVGNADQQPSYPGAGQRRPSMARRSTRSAPMATWSRSRREPAGSSGRKRPDRFRRGAWHVGLRRVAAGRRRHARGDARRQHGAGGIEQADRCQERAGQVDRGNR